MLLWAPTHVVLRRVHGPHLQHSRHGQLQEDHEQPEYEDEDFGCSWSEYEDEDFDDGEEDEELEESDDDFGDLKAIRARFIATRQLRQQIHAFNCTFFKRNATRNCARRRRILQSQRRRNRSGERYVCEHDHVHPHPHHHHQHQVNDLGTNHCQSFSSLVTLAQVHDQALADSTSSHSQDDTIRIDSSTANSTVTLLQEELHEMQDRMAFLERSNALQHSYRLTARINRFGAAVEILGCYYSQFQCGYDPSNFAMFLHNQISREMLFSIMDANVMSRDCRGIQNFLFQWETYTRHHRSLRITVRNMTLVEQDEHILSVATPGEMRLVFSEDTIEKLYPSLLRDQEDGVLVASQLVGKEMVLPFEKVFHFNAQGKIFVLETKVNLLEALQQVVSGPMAASQIAQASVITEEGHWKPLDEPSGIQCESQWNELPKQLLG